MHSCTFLEIEIHKMITMNVVHWIITMENWIHVYQIATRGEKDSWMNCLNCHNDKVFGL
jgi:hypothetical protein